MNPKIGFNIEEIEDYHQVSSLNKQETENKFKKFIQTFYNLNQSHN